MDINMKGLKNIKEVVEDSPTHNILRRNVETSIDKVKDLPLEAVLNLKIRELCGCKPEDIIAEEFYPRETELTTVKNGLDHFKIIEHSANWPTSILQDIHKLAQLGHKPEDIWARIHHQIALRRGSVSKKWHHYTNGVMWYDTHKAVQGADLERRARSRGQASMQDKKLSPSGHAEGSMEIK